jgi:hypothetical protein
MYKFLHFYGGKCSDSGHVGCYTVQFLSGYESFGEHTASSFRVKLMMMMMMMMMMMISTVRLSRQPAQKMVIQIRGSGRGDLIQVKRSSMQVMRKTAFFT